MIVTLVLRVLSLLFAAVVLGLTVTLYKGEIKGDRTDGTYNYTNPGPPAQTNYAIFCGAWALLFAFIGIGAIFVEFLQGMIMAILDALSSLITLIGGIVYAVGLHGGSCSNTDYLQSNRIIRGAGTIQDTDIPAYNRDDDLGSRCHEAQAVMVFLFFLFACFLATAVLGLFGKGRRSGGRGYA